MLLNLISVFSPLAAIIAGARRKRVQLWYYSIACIFSDLFISGSRMFHLDNASGIAIVANAFILAQFLLVSFAYRKRIFKSDAVFGLVISVLSLAFLAHSFMKGISSFNFTGASISYFAFIVYSLFGFYTIMQRQEVLRLERSYFFWINVAFITYGSGSLLLFLFRDVFREENNQLFIQLWRYMFVVLNILKNICIGIAITQLKPTDDELR